MHDDVGSELVGLARTFAVDNSERRLAVNKWPHLVQLRVIFSDVQVRKVLSVDVFVMIDVCQVDVLVVVEAVPVSQCNVDEGKKPFVLEEHEGEHFDTDLWCRELQKKILQL